MANLSFTLNDHTRELKVYLTCHCTDSTYNTHTFVSIVCLGDTSKYCSSTGTGKTNQMV